MSPADQPMVHATTASQWRRWLRENHNKADGVWLVSWRPVTGKPRLSYEESIPEALAYGWIDSVHRPLDAERTALRFTPRRTGSVWSRTNKRRVARLLRDGRMRAAGLARIVEAKRDGSWSLLDSVETLTMPPDLRRALGARGLRAFGALSISARKAHLRGLATPKRAETRARRVTSIARAVRS